MYGKQKHHLSHALKYSASIGAVILSLSLLTACSGDGNNGGDSDENNSDDTSSLFPSAGNEAGSFTINSSGGNGNSLGGDGGTIRFTLNDGLEGRLEALNNGLTNASFTVPSNTADTGSSGVTISTNTTISVTATEPANNILYMVADDTRLYKSNADGILAQTSEVVSGLSIDAGSTLTLDLNASTASAADLTFTDDIENNGTITTADNGTAKGDLALWANNIFTAAASSITTAGTDSTVVDGGVISLTADEIISNIGTVNSSGFTDTDTISPVNGGDAGDITLGSILHLYNTGAITADGGSAADTTGNIGGNGGVVLLSANYDGVNNSAAISSNGGNGDTAAGLSGTISLTSNKIGEVINSGDLTANGGNSTNGNGGSGSGNDPFLNRITLTSNGGNLTNSGNLSGNGGTATDGNTAGNGGAIDIRTDWGEFNTPPGNLLISGNISNMGGSILSNGGIGGTGGNSNYVDIKGNINGQTKFPAPQLVGLWGYTAIIANGGNGESGGEGGAFSISSQSTQALSVDNNYQWKDPSDIINEVNISTKGGNSTSTNITNKRGGLGGYTQITAAFNPPNTVHSPPPSHNATISNSGNITTSSGNNHEFTGGTVASGVVIITSGGDITNSGTISTNGGNDDGLSAAPGKGNSAGRVTITSSTGNVFNSGAISTMGGDGKLNGGIGGNVSITGAFITNSNNITSNGGDADAAVASSIGADAGTITFTATAASGLSNSGTSTSDGGTGETIGMGGRQYNIVHH